jgi:hypothetical protein
MTNCTLNFIDRKTELKVNQIKCTKLNAFWEKEAIIPDTLFALGMKIFKSQDNIV